VLYYLHSVIATVYVSHLRNITFLLTYDTFYVLYYTTKVFLHKETRIQHSINMHRERKYNKQNKHSHCRIMMMQTGSIKS